MTLEQQKLVEAGLPAANRVASSFLRQFGPTYDFHGEVALRLCKTIDRFDLNRGCISIWAAAEARGACIDEIRRRSKIRGRKVLRQNHSVDLNMIAAKSGKDLEIDSSILHGLMPINQELLLATYAYGEDLEIVRKRLGLGKYAAIRMRTSSGNFLRARRLHRVVA